MRAVRALTPRRTLRTLRPAWTAALLLGCSVEIEDRLVSRAGASCAGATTGVDDDERPDGRGDPDRKTSDEAERDVANGTHIRSPRIN